MRVVKLRRGLNGRVGCEVRVVSFSRCLQSSQVLSLAVEQVHKMLNDELGEPSALVSVYPLTPVYPGLTTLM